MSDRMIEMRCKAFSGDGVRMNRVQVSDDGTVRVASAILGAVLFRFLIAFALYVGMNPIDLKLLTAAFVLATLVISKGLSERQAKRVSLGVFLRRPGVRRRGAARRCG